MKNYEGIMSIGNMDLRGLVIEKSPNSLLVASNRKIYVPEKMLILMDQATEQEFKHLMKTGMPKGGVIL